MEKKYIIYRILAIRADGSRKSVCLNLQTDHLEEQRKLLTAMTGAERVFLSYHEREE
ncbi:MAG: hypothetical protein IJ494_01970 [Bacteroides sp.]|nr:hypothetical protein [Bacteroides sp.]